VLKPEECVSSGTGSSNPRQQTTKALRSLDLAAKKLAKSTKASRIVSRKILIAINKTRLAVGIKGDSCEENITNAINNLVEILDEVNSKICTGSTSQSCIPEQIVNDFFDAASDSIDIILSALDIDTNDDSVPDLCGKK
jgi:hypothetical protein